MSDQAAAAPVELSLSACWEAVRGPDAPFTSWQALVDSADKTVCDELTPNTGRFSSCSRIHAHHSHSHSSPACTPVTQDSLEEVRRAYDAFLQHWPLCFFYVHKYAQSAARRGARASEVAAIYERGVAHLPHCPALWIYYLAWRTGTTTSEPAADAAAVHALCERAVAAAGADFDAGELWLRCAEHELHAGSAGAGAAVRVLARAAAVPLQQGAAVWAQFAALVARARVQDVLPPAAVDALGRAIAAAPSAEAAAQLEDRARAAFVARVEAAHRRATARAAARAVFENVVLSRSYFHVKSVETPVLEAWRQYLTYAEQQVQVGQDSGGDDNNGKDKNKDKKKENDEKQDEEDEYENGIGKEDEAWVRGLYERCLVPCAAYEEFWLRYAAHLLRAGDAEGARQVLERAAAFVPRGGTAALTLQRALLAEHAGDIPRARSLFTALLAQASAAAATTSAITASATTTTAPTAINNNNENTTALCEAADAAASFEWRAGSAPAARAVFERAIAEAHGHGDGDAAAALAGRYALHLEARGDAAGCDGALEAALERQPACAALWALALDVRCARCRHAPAAAGSGADSRSTAERAAHRTFYRALGSGAWAAGPAALLARWALFCREGAAAVAVVRGVAEDAARAAHGLPAVWLAQPAHLALLGITPPKPAPEQPHQEDEKNVAGESASEDVVPPPAKHARTDSAPDPNVVSLATTTTVDLD